MSQFIFVSSIMRDKFDENTMDLLIHYCHYSDKVQQVVELNSFSKFHQIISFDFMYDNNISTSIICSKIQRAHLQYLNLKILCFRQVVINKKKLTYQIVLIVIRIAKTNPSKFTLYHKTLSITKNDLKFTTKQM